MVVARFQTHVGGASLSLLSGLPEGMGFGMRTAEFLVPALRHHHPILHQDAPHHRVGMDTSPTLPTQVDGSGQVFTISRGQMCIHGFQKVIRRAREPK